MTRRVVGLTTLVAGALAAASGFQTPAYQQAVARQAAQAQFPAVPPPAKWIVTLAQAAQTKISISALADNIGFDIDCQPASDGKNSWLRVMLEINGVKYNESETITSPCGIDKLPDLVGNILDKIAKEARLPEIFAKPMRDAILDILRAALRFK